MAAWSGSEASAGIRSIRSNRCSRYLPLMTNDTVRSAWLRLLVLAAGCGATIQGATPGDGPGVISIEQGNDASPLGIPLEQLPAPGECRLWLPGRPASAQAGPGPCTKIEPGALGGSWVLDRPADKPEEVYVRVIDPRRVGVVVAIRRYRAATGEYLGRMEP